MAFVETIHKSKVHGLDFDQMKVLTVYYMTLNNCHQERIIQSLVGQDQLVIWNQVDMIGYQAYIWIIATNSVK